MKVTGEIRPNTIAIAATAGLGLLSWWLWWLKCQKNKIPTKWKKVGELVDLVCYPVKSMGPVKTNSLEASSMGLKNGWMRDRILMVIDQDGNFVTARQYPKMVLIEPRFKHSVLLLNANKVDPNLDELSIDLAELDKKQTRRAVIYRQEVDVVDCGDEAAIWLSRCLLSEDNGFRLVYYPEDKPSRYLRYRYKNMANCDVGAFADETSYSLVSEASLADLNSKLKNTPPITSGNFRQNFVIKDPEAFEEDNWDWVKIGEVVFRHARPCTRCIFTTIDPLTGVKNPNFEPIKTLRTYRMIKDPVVRAKLHNSPCMGVLLGQRGSDGVLRVGDAVYIGDDA